MKILGIICALLAYTSAAGANQQPVETSYQTGSKSQADFLPQDAAPKGAPSRKLFQEKIQETEDNSVEKDGVKYQTYKSSPGAEYPSATNFVFPEPTITRSPNLKYDTYTYEIPYTWKTVYGEIREDVLVITVTPIPTIQTKENLLEQKWEEAIRTFQQNTDFGKWEYWAPMLSKKAVPLMKP